jgi:hypothetical protein
VGFVLGDVIEIHQKRIFSLNEAEALLPVIRRVTKATQANLEPLTRRLPYTENGEAKAALEKEIQSFFQAWCRKVERLGAEAKGLWIVDFDSGNGYYCWHYPESKISFYHGYAEGFRGRVPIQ